MKAAIYARYSSENQRESSIEDQVHLCRQEAERRGYVVTHTFQDAEMSGQRDDRPGFQAMLAAAEQRAFEVLVVDDTSRLSRDTSDALRTLKRLQYWKVGLVSRDGIDTVKGEKGSALLYGMRSVMAEEFLRDLAAKTWRGQQGAVQRGFNAGGACYGYRSEAVGTDGYRLTAYAPEAEIVRRIFSLRVGDGELRPLSLREIAMRLNRDHVPPPGARWRGRTARQCATWSFTAVRGIVLNPLYTGRVVWNRTEWVRHPDTRKRLRRARPADDWIERQDETLRIISADVWKRTQARAAAARLGAGVPNYRLHGRAKYLLSGFVLCGVCGAHYVVANRYSYRCASSRDRGPVACTNTVSVRRDVLEAAVVPAIRDHLYTPQTVGPLVAAVRKELLRRAEEYRRRPGQDNKALATVEGEIANIEQAILQGRATTHLLAMLEARVAARDALLTREQPTKGVEERLASTLERLPALVAKAVEDLQALLAVQQIDQGKELLSLLVERIVLLPKEGYLEAEVRGSLQGLLKLKSPRSGNQGLREITLVAGGGFEPPTFGL